jgi:hypothetical protein
MALADFDALRALLAQPTQILQRGKDVSAGTGKTGRFVNLWARDWQPGAIPSTAVAPTNSTVGAFQKADGGSGRQLILSGDVQCAFNASQRALPMMVIDRLSHQGGLVGNVITSQTTNLPTAALTRYTSGVGVMAAIQSWSGPGVTASRLDVTYTNSAGTGSRVGQFALPSSEIASTGHFQPIPLVGGDLGVRSVESIQFSVSLGGSPGNLGIVLFKPLGFVVVPPDTGHFDWLDNVMWNEEVLDGACLDLVTFVVSSSSTAYSQTLALAEC